jgi:transcriptional regulator with GAF, ATPase, and Fis domain
VTIAVSAPDVDAPPVGYLRLGPRKGGDLYSRRDRALLSALADQLGIAMANGRAYERIAQMSRVLAEQNREIRDLRDRLEDENRYLKGRLGDHHRGEKVLTGSSKAIRELRKTLARVARSAAVVLLHGETGTGKSLVARALHEASPRAEGPFIHVDCGAIPGGVFESELFGHEKGAFTGAIRNRRGAFELADGGTLFLDEIGELPLELQPKLVRFFSERKLTRVGGTEEVEVDVRVVAATHRRLDEMVRKKEFREDLYYRLAVVEIDVPPLRARRGDVRELAQALLPRLCRRNHIRERRLTDAAMERLEAYGWPGNVRELMNVLERAAVLSEGTSIDADDLALSDKPPTADELGASSSVEDDAAHREVMEAIERDRLIAALKASGGNRSSAARTLGMPRTTLINKIRRYGLEEN